MARSCRRHTQTELDRLGDDNRLAADIEADPVRTTRPRRTRSTWSTPREKRRRRRCAPDGLHVHRSNPAAVASRAQRHGPDQRRPGPGRPEDGPAGGAQRLRHRRSRPHGRSDDERGRPRRGLHRRDREDGAHRPDGHAGAGGRPEEDQGPGGPGVPLRAGALRARGARRAAAVEHHGPALGDRRDRVRDAADHRLCADRARRLLQAEGAGRHADRAGGGRREGPRLPDPHQLDPGAAGRAPHLRRLPGARRSIRARSSNTPAALQTRRLPPTSPARRWRPPRTATMDWSPTCTPMCGPTPAGPA